MTHVLMHTCCAPCSVACIEQLRSESIEPVSFWFNPNIHPYMEYKARRDTLMSYATAVDMDLIVKEDYGIREFCKNVADDIDHRCAYCYRVRMENTAKFAKEYGFETFTSTLFISPYQNHELLKNIAQEMAEKYGVNFLYRDFRPYFKEGQEKARAQGLYMQKYCGCIFSEEDRYRSKIEKDLKQPIKKV